MNTSPIKLALVQMNVGSDKAANLDKAERLVATAIEKEKPHWLALPEMFDFADSNTDKRAIAEILGEGPAYRLAQTLARKYSIHLHAGSFHEWRPDIQRISNTSVVFNPRGEQIALYRKLHLFDIVTPSGVSYQESAHIAAGDEVVTYPCEGLTFGCAICYDLRFPELFQALRLRGADIIAVPSAFTRETGRAHWEILLRARAIETQCYIAAPAQTGPFMQDNQQRFTFGHSLIADPWGDIAARLENELENELENGDGYLAAELDREKLARIRTNMPLMQHRRFALPQIVKPA